jgi:hypothetical protein
LGIFSRGLRVAALGLLLFTGGCGPPGGTAPAGQAAASHRPFFVRGIYGRDATCRPAGDDSDNGCHVATGVDGMRAAGFNTVQADATPTALAALAAKGLKAIVWLGDWNKQACTWQIPDSRLPLVIAAVKRSPAVLAYYLADEPLLSSCPDAPAAFRARTGLVHSLDPGSRTFTLIQAYDHGPVDYSKWVGAVDVLGFDLYPCSFKNGLDFSARPKVRSSCDFSGVVDSNIERIERAGITSYWGVLQDFQDCYYELPTRQDLRTQITHWQRLGHHLAGYLVFSWNWMGERCTYGSLGVNLSDVPRNVAELDYENRHFF